MIPKLWAGVHWLAAKILHVGSEIINKIVEFLWGGNNYKTIKQKQSV